MRSVRRSESEFGIRMTRWLNEIQACMHAVIDDFLSIDTVLLLQISIEARFNVLNNRFPTATDLSDDVN